MSRKLPDWKRPSTRFERLCAAIVRSYLSACSASPVRVRRGFGDRGEARANLRRAALIGCADHPAPEWDRLNHHNVARAFVAIALAAELYEDIETMFASIQLAKAWGFDWRSWLRDRSQAVH